ncbi:MAG: prephenate dehydratase domain-containing protein, partial [Polyangiales bacterium]
MSQDLASLRRQLDVVDAQLVDALAARERLVMAVAAQKQDGDAPLRDPAREQALLGRVADLGRAQGLDEFFLTRVFRELLDHSLRRQQAALSGSADERPAATPWVVAYQGVEGSYSHRVATRHFGPYPGAVQYVGYEAFEPMLLAVAQARADFAVLPIENTTAGSINESYDLLARMDLSLVGEEVQAIDHALISPAPVPLSQIRRVYSHPQALLQCSRFLRSLPDCRVEAYHDTAAAVAKVRDEGAPHQAAIASAACADLYGMTLLKRDIANQRANYTRMVIVAREATVVDPRLPCKTSLIFATTHEEGALLRCLSIFAAHHLSLTKLESRPRARVPWHYLFYVDFEGNRDTPAVTRALAELADTAAFVKVLGCYPARTTAAAAQAAPRPRLERQSRSQPLMAGASRSEAMTVSEETTVPAAASSDAPLPASCSVRESGVLAPGAIQTSPTSGPAPMAPAPTAVRLRAQVARRGGWTVMLHLGEPDTPAMLRTRMTWAKECGAQVVALRCAPHRSPAGVAALPFSATRLQHGAALAEELDVALAVEISSLAEVDLAAAEADVLQVGGGHLFDHALLAALGRLDRPVLLRRAAMASVGEWLAAAEVLMAQGNRQVILVEQGIRSVDAGVRRSLDLNAIAMVHERSGLP